MSPEEEAHGNMSLCREGVVALTVFLLTFIGVIICHILRCWINSLISIPAFVLTAFGLCRFCLKYFDVKIANRALFLGASLGFGVIITTSDLSWRLCGWYIMALSFFHWSEYFFTALTNPQNLNLDSYLLNHSLEYHLAVVASFIEYILEWMYFPVLTEPNIVSIVGLSVVIFGEVLRKGAMWNAGTNFNHHIRNRREADHILVTSGFYGFCRHPAYVGWFCWSVGTQVMMCNPMCAILYAIFSWSFFRERIITEEYTLVRFFGNDYLEYQRRVPTGLPFIAGYRPDLTRS